MSTPTPSPPPAPSRGRLVRRRDDRLLSGVCGGLAAHLGVDATLVRIGVVVLSALGGFGILAYLVAVAIVPDERAEEPLVRTGRLDDGDARMPYVLAGLVVAVVVSGAGPLPWGGWDAGGWVIALLGGAALVVAALRIDRSAPTGVAASASGLVAPGPTAVTAVAPDAPEASGEETTAVHAPAVPEVVPGPAPHVARPRRSARLGLGMLLLVLGALGLLLSTVDDLAVETAIALAVLACGVVAVFAAPFGGVRAVVGIGFVFAAVGGVAAAADLELRGGFGERVEAPRTAADIPREYRLGAGSLTVDLRDTALPRGTTTVTVRAGAAEVVVLTPPGATVIARARAGIGEVEALGRREEGGSADVRARSRRASPVRLVVDARVGVGELEIRQAAAR